MNIKNNVSLTLAEAVELLTKIADSLEQKHQFAFDLKGQEVSIEAGSQMHAFLSLSPDEFSIVFNWAETEVPQEQQSYEPPMTTSTQPVYEEPVVVNNVHRRSLPDRMPLNTTTLPYDAGYWAPAFTTSNEAIWTKIDIDSELENKKWASEDQITTLSDLTPASAKPKKRSRLKSNDDLFSELDNLDDKPKPKSSIPDQGVNRVKIPENRAVHPAGGPPPTIPKPSASSIPSPSSGSPRASIPSPPNPTAPASQSSNWQEPQPESSGDTWVKPSEVLKSKSSSRPGISNIPSPTAQRTSENKVENIPVPSSGLSKKAEEVIEWSEPSAEDNVTDDDWIKPSEFLKKSKEEDKKAKRPPPKAPDADEDKKKGWASWD